MIKGIDYEEALTEHMPVLSNRVMKARQSDIVLPAGSFEVIGGHGF